MLELGVIADDLTGGMMVASLLEREGVACPLVTSTEGLAGLDEDAEAVVIGRKIRLLPPEEAVADARRSAEALLAQAGKTDLLQVQRAFHVDRERQYRTRLGEPDGVDGGRPCPVLSNLARCHGVPGAALCER